VRIKGFIGTTLVDYPGRIAASVFVGGCNYRCPFCYNVELVLEPDKMEDIPEEDVLASLNERKTFIDGIVMTGGEPTLYDDLPKFFKKVKSLGLLIKLDTNGTRPRMIENLLRDQLVDYVAMDYKAPLALYSSLAGVEVEEEPIRLSAQLLINSRVDYEFRTTVHPGLLNPEDILQITREIKGAKKYVIQPFYATECLDPSIGVPPSKYIEDLRTALEPVKDDFEELVFRDPEY